MSSDKIPFTKSIRFKMTLIYSLITFIFSGLVVLTLNYSINTYFNEIDPFVGMGGNPQRMYNKPLLTEEQKEIIQEARLADVREIQSRSLDSLFPLALLSFALGYVLSGSITKPLISIQKKVDLLTDQELGMQLNIKGEDEIAKLGQSFDKMSLRLKESFDSQVKFVQDASHELKTPLAIIQSNLEELLDSKVIKEKVALETVETAVNGVKRMNSLTERLLDLSSKKDLNIKKIDLTDVVNLQIEELKRKASESNVKIQKLEGKNVYIQADEIALTQMIFNLLDNSIKYSHEGRDSEVDVKIDYSSKFPKLIISDNGIGIPKGKQKKIFDRFYQVDNSRDSKKEGSGLGLSIVKSIVEKHGWDIKVKSSLKGSTFMVEFKS